jgi:endonuclease YncB( thermonuclease family)
MKNIFTLVFLFLSFLIFSQSGKIVKIKDGDTVVLLDEMNNQITLRLAEVDCPESGQPFGKQAKQFTANEVGMKSVTYQVLSKDRYGRKIAKIFYDGKYLSQELIKNGLGWHYKQYSNSIELSKNEINAKKMVLGLWKQKNPTPPWEFRKYKKLPGFAGWNNIPIIRAEEKKD